MHNEYLSAKVMSKERGGSSDFRNSEIVLSPPQITLISHKLEKKLFIVEISVSLFDDIEESTIFLETYMKKMGYLHTNSFRYKILHNKILHNKIFLMAQLYATWKKHGIQFLFTVIKRKIK